MSVLSVGLLLFPEFEVLDVAGPIGVLNVVTRHLQKDLKLSIISESLDIVSAGASKEDRNSPFLAPQRYPPTHTVYDAPPLDVLLVPGGAGTRRTQEQLQPYIDFIARVYKGYDDHPPIANLFSICTGAALLARAGVLDGHKATTNKRSWKWATPQGPKTTWIARARWVVDRRIWTTSGITAGMDGMVAYVAALYGEEAADKTCHAIEHNRVKDSDDDPWADANGCEDVYPTSQG